MRDCSGRLPRSPSPVGRHRHPGRVATRNATSENLDRAAVEAVLASVASLFTWYGVECNTVLLIGDGARSEAIRAVAPGIFGVPVDVPEPEEYVAWARPARAAWALAGIPESGTAAAAPPAHPALQGSPKPSLLEPFAALRDATAIWEEGITP